MGLLTVRTPPTRSAGRNHMKGNPDPARTCAELRALGSRPPNAVRRRAVVDALGSRFESVQVVAAQILGKWGGRDAVEGLRRLLVRAMAKDAYGAVARQAAEALAECVEPRDAGWVLDLFAAAPFLGKHTLAPVVRALPVELTGDRLKAECRSTRRENRHGAMIAMNGLAIPGKRKVYEALTRDSDPTIREVATAFLSSDRLP